MKCVMFSDFDRECITIEVHNDHTLYRVRLFIYTGLIEETLLDKTQDEMFTHHVIGYTLPPEMVDVMSSDDISMAMDILSVVRG